MNEKIQTIDELIRNTVQEYARQAVLEERELLKAEVIREVADLRVGIKTLSEIIGQSEGNIRLKIRHKKIPYEIVGGAYLIDLRELKKNLHACKFHNPEIVNHKLQEFIKKQLQAIT